MANSVTNVAVAAFVGAAAAIIAGVIGIDKLADRGAAKRMVHAEIHLDMVGGDCMIQTSPQTLEVFKRETIQWTILDACPDDNGDVQIVFTGDNPLDANCTPRGRRKITCSVSPSANNIPPYKYEVRAANAVTEDPELEIVQ
jgi:hypothetical protein